MSEQPFAGITVIEFGQFIAVPYCAQLLADGGARKGAVCRMFPGNVHGRKR